ncbi:MAG: ImmA/IrrE family metallo-endopeptidase [Allosphingosinicella sp.]|uniref:ImmA/IrrE family metallo-endopeptidase n=1 Tax=Allosphingosinicella sp. TaxID=2823234 RepID=UPI003959349C
MSRFRLAWARQCGERKAKEHGFTAFPVDPRRIAEDEDIHISPKRPDQPGVSGGIIFSDIGVAIFHSTDIASAGFQRFTIAHELGHYFLEGHPEEIQKVAPVHVSRAGFTQGDSSIELEADHFASGLLMPTRLVRDALERGPVGFAGIEELADRSECSLTASAIRAAECSPYPMAIVVSRGERICYGFLSDGFRQLKPRAFPRKGDLLPDSVTREFNSEPANVAAGWRVTGETSLSDWFDGPSGIRLDEEVIGLGRYGFTLSVFSSEDLPEEPDEEEDEEAALEERWRPRFAYGR